MARRMPKTGGTDMKTTEQSLPRDIRGSIYYDIRKEQFIRGVRVSDKVEVYDSPAVRTEGRSPIRVSVRHKFVKEIDSRYIEVSYAAKKEPVARREQLERYMATDKISTPLTGDNLADYKWCKRVTKIVEY